MNDELAQHPNDGKRTYTRRPDVEDRVRQLAALRPAEREREILMLCQSISPGQHYPAGVLEVLVWAVRHGCRRISKAHDEAAARLYAVSNLVLRAKVRRFGYSNIESERIVEETLTAVMEHLLVEDAKISFWECQFLRCLIYRFETISTKSKVRRSLSDAASLDADSLPEVSDEAMSVEDTAMLRTIMAGLSEEERMVLYLKCVEQLPEESSDASVDTIARRLGRTGRTVRNILTRIRERHIESETNQ
jgi:DNA-directed RNA polymerase specialized sigma24 family protein